MKRQLNRITVIILITLLGTGGIFAQHKQEISVSGSGGLSFLDYKLTGGERKSGLGGLFGLGYHFFFSPVFGLGTGVEIACYNSKYELGNYNFSSMATDIEGANFEFRSSLNGYDEKHYAMMLQIPLMLQMQTGGKHQFYLAAGGKLGIPLKGKYNNTTSSLNNSGFYVYENSLYDTQEFMGFGKFTNKKYDGEINFDMKFLASAEAGVKIRLSDKRSLYAGAYIDYGLDNIMKTVDSYPSFVEYNIAHTPPFVINSVLNSKYSQGAGNVAQVPTNEIKPMAIGIKLRLAFGL